MSDYTLTTGEVEAVYVYQFDNEPQAAADFAAWLRSVKAEAWDEGRAVGYNDGNGGESAFRQTNPYKED